MMATFSRIFKKKIKKIINDSKRFNTKVDDFYKKQKGILLGTTSKSE